MRNQHSAAEKIKEISGTNPLKCMKCGKCSATCPSFNEMDIKPHQFVSYVVNEDIEALVNSKSLWKCLSCFACVERCPRDVKPGKIIDAARQLVVREKGGDYLKADEIPQLLDPELPQQLLVSAFRRYRRYASVQRIGVFVCHCGSNIAATVDVKKVVELAAKEPGVVHAEDYQYMCSEAGQAKIQEAIKEKNLTGVVVCSCSPRMHEATFRKAAERAGLNPYMVEIANIREHCSWIHKDMEEATKKAVILARAAIAKVNLNTPLQPGESPDHRRRYCRNPDSPGYRRCRI